MRKRNVAIFLAGMYLILLFRPAWPRLLFELNKGYIQTTLCEQRAVKGNCCRGACFLRKHLQDDAQKRPPVDTRPSAQLEWAKLPPPAPMTVPFPAHEPEDWHCPRDNCEQDQYADELNPPPPWRHGPVQAQV